MTSGAPGSVATSLRRPNSEFTTPVVSYAG